MDVHVVEVGKLAWPSCMLLAGPSLSGKSSLVFKIVKSEVYEKSPTLVYYCYNEWQPLFETLPSDVNVLFHEGLPELEELKKISKTERVLLILDDLMTRLDKFSDAEKLFSVASHHYDMSIIAVIHSIFYSKTIRNLRLNSSYLCIFKNNADMSAIRNLASQLFPGNRAMFIKTYEDATRLPHSYLFVDNHKTTQKDLRLRTSLFSDEVANVYVEK